MNEHKWLGSGFCIVAGYCAHTSRAVRSMLLGGGRMRVRHDEFECDLFTWQGCFVCLAAACLAMVYLAVVDIIAKRDCTIGTPTQHRVLHNHNSKPQPLLHSPFPSIHPLATLPSAHPSQPHPQASTHTSTLPSIPASPLTNTCTQLIYEKGVQGRDWGCAMDFEPWVVVVEP